MSYLQETYHLFMKWFDSTYLKPGMTVLYRHDPKVVIPGRKVPTRLMRWVLVRELEYGEKVYGKRVYSLWPGKWWARPVCKPKFKPILFCFDFEMNTQKYKLRDAKGKPLYD